ncbi:MAG: glycosyltransferase [Candidatus Parvarchaeota archaeon]
MNFPSVDIIIPTFNCEKDIKRCLECISSQKYPGEMNIIIVDGGSSDGTINVAKSFTSRVYVNVGQYGTGKNGAKAFGESVSRGELIWHLDSDNFVIGENCLINLVKPLMEDENISFSVPVPEIDPFASSLSNWLAMREIYNLNSRIKVSTKVHDYYLISDMDYGLTNGCLIRRDVLKKVGGYDSDVRLLMRMRKKKLSTAAIVPNSKFYHNQTTGYVDYLKKWLRRSKKFSAMGQEQLRDYFVEYPLPKYHDRALKNQISGMIVSSLYLSLRNFLASGDTKWLIGIPYSVILILAAVSHPLIAYRLWRNFL